MAKFTFRLQSYLGVKEQLEEQKKNEYGQALRRVEEEKQKKRLMEEERARMIVTFKESLTTAINPADIRRYNNRLELLKNRIKEQQERIVEAEAAAELRRLELVEAMKERKMLEAVKEKSYETYLEEEKRAEQRVVDEIVSYQYAEREAVNG